MNREIAVSDRRQQETAEIDILDLLTVWKQHIIVIAVAVLIGAIAGLVCTRFFITPMYTAQSSIYVVSTEDDLNIQDLNLGTSLTKDYVELLQSKMMLEQVSNVTGRLYSPDALKKMLSVTNQANTRIVVIQITSPDPQKSQYIAKTFGEQATTYLPDIISMSAKPPILIDSADLPNSPSNIKYARNAFLGALACLVIVLAFFTVLYFLNDTFNSSEDVETYLGFAPMAVIPKNGLKHKGAYSYEYRKKGSEQPKKNDSFPLSSARWAKAAASSSSTEAICRRSVSCSSPSALKRTVKYRADMRRSSFIGA